mmetsp:Transcript_32043/g.54042  ORF Transcript_32043/g.54042 Transcript_32043/m.54042 type:complete len:395 (+) Transcript_32043:124-1308(+)
MPPPAPRKENLSGHVCFDVPQTRFFQEVNRRVNRLEVARRYGMVEKARERNPLLAEKSPRNENIKFDFDTPAAPADTNRWAYPDSDWGLMAKFRSQKHIYDEIHRKEKEYNLRMSELTALRDFNQIKIREEFNRQKAQFDADKKSKELDELNKMNAANHQFGGAGHHHHHHHHHQQQHAGGAAVTNKDGGLDELDLALKRDQDAKEAARLAREKKKKGHHMLMTLTPDPEPITDFYKAGITKFRTVGEAHPEVLAEWRAKRAADYVAKRDTHPLEPPRPRAIVTKPFRPGGILPARETAYRGKGQMGSETERAEIAREKARRGASAEQLTGIDFKTLKKELAKTEEEMARQQLKIKLNTKPLSRFETAKDERASVKRKEAALKDKSDWLENNDP